MLWTLGRPFVAHGARPDLLNRGGEHWTVMIRLLALLTTQAPCFGWIVHSDSYNGDDLMAYEMTIPFLGIPSSTWRAWPFFCKRGSCSGVLGGSRPMSTCSWSLRGLHVVAVSNPPVSCTLEACSFRPRRLAHNTTGPGLRFPRLFLFPCTGQRAGFFCLFRKKRRDVAGSRSNGLCPTPGFGFLFCSCLWWGGGGAREKESERLGHIGLPFLLCVCSRFYVWLMDCIYPL